MGILNRDQILAAHAIQRETVAVPEWGGDVLVQEFTGETRDRWEQSMWRSVEGNPKAPVPNTRARMAAFSVVDEQGAPLFSEADIEALGKKSVAALDRVVAVADRLNGLSEESVVALEKNLLPGPSDASISA